MLHGAFGVALEILKKCCYSAGASLERVQRVICTLQFLATGAKHPSGERFLIKPIKAVIILAFYLSLTFTIMICTSIQSAHWKKAGRYMESKTFFGKGVLVSSNLGKTLHPSYDIPNDTPEITISWILSVVCSKSKTLQKPNKYFKTHVSLPFHYLHRCVHLLHLTNLSL